MCVLRFRKTALSFAFGFHSTMVVHRLPFIPAHREEGWSKLLACLYHAHIGARIFGVTNPNASSESAVALSVAVAV